MAYATNFDDEELGFIAAAGQAAGKLLGGIGKGLKKAVKKKKKKPAAGKVIQMPATDIVGTVPKDVLTPIVKAAAKAKAKTGKVDLKSMTLELVDKIPPLVRVQVLEALKEAKNTAASNAQTLGSITESVDDALKPQITAMLAALQAQGISKQATYEHDELVKRADFERKTTDGLAALAERLEAMDKSFTLRLKDPKIAIVTQKLPIFGPKNVLQG